MGVPTDTWLRPLFGAAFTLSDAADGGDELVLIDVFLEQSV